MALQKVSDADILRAWETTKSPTKLAGMLGISLRRLQLRLRKLGIGAASSKTALLSNRSPGVLEYAAGREDLEVYNGTVIVFSDAHYYPGTASTAHRALLYFVQELKPTAIVCNGDAADGARISRHARIGWDSKPTVKEELDTVTDRLGEIVGVSSTGALYWTLGNHDARFETYLATAAPQYEGIYGFTLKDHFPEWIPCWGLWINGNTVVKHRWNGGYGAARKNALNSGVSIITGHTHCMKVDPFSDYNGTRWGVDTGTLAAPYGEQFADYTEINPVDWRSGFAILTFWNGELLWPELVYVRNEKQGLVEFRGTVYQV